MAFQALEVSLNREALSLLVCTANQREAGGSGDADGGGMVRELYTTHRAAERYRRDEESLNCVLESFNFKTLDDNLQKLDDQTAELLDLIMTIDRLTTWEQPLRSLCALSGCLVIFYYDAVWMILPGILLSVAGQAVYTGLKIVAWPAIRVRVSKLFEMPNPSVVQAKTSSKDVSEAKRRQTEAKERSSPPTTPIDGVPITR